MNNKINNCFESKAKIICQEKGMGFYKISQGSIIQDQFFCFNISSDDRSLDRETSNYAFLKNETDECRRW